MPSPEKFSLLRRVLRALGLSAEAVDDIIERISDFLFEKDKTESQRNAASSAAQGEAAVQPVYPYLVRDDFLSAAERQFYLVLRSAVADKAIICPKVALGDLFYAKTNLSSEYRIFTNKIDRKHVDFLLCDPLTVRPIVGIELDDKSHQRSDRQARDEFVEAVYAAANLPLVRIPVRASFDVSELRSLLQAHFAIVPVAGAVAPVVAEKPNVPPRCPKCGRDMVLRTAKSGANQGGQFWGCSDYPRCHGLLKYTPEPVS